MPGDAAGAPALFEVAFGEWQAGVRALDDDGLQQPLGSRGGPDADDSYASLVLHVNREVMAHGAEVCLLRDLYRGRALDDDPLTAAALAGDAATVQRLGASGAGDMLAAEAAGRGHWGVVRALVAAGASGEGALHYAAAAGEAEAATELVAHGARLDALGPLYGQTPSGWAAFCGHHELAQRLRP